MTNLVFHDPSGRRARRAGFGVGLLLAALFAILGAFVATLAIAPSIPGVTFANPRAMHALDGRVEVLSKHPAWTRPPPRVTGAHGSRTHPLSIGFYVSWDDTSRESLTDHIGQLDIVSPQWVSLKGADGQIDPTTDVRADKLIAAAPHRPSVMPLVHNSDDKLWNGKLADRLLTSVPARHALIANLLALAKQRGYAGYVFDLENMSKVGLAAYPSFIAEANAAFQSSGREIWVTAPFDDSDWPLKALGQASDTLVLMAYDEHYWTGGPGPVASQAWFEKHLTEGFGALDPNKTVLALGAFGYDWVKGGHGDPASFHEATLTAQDAGAKIRFDRAALNPTFNYADEDGQPHTVWFLDAATLYNQVHMADAWRPRGYALWRMGTEDPGVWKILGKPYGSAKVGDLRVMPPSADVDFNGTGEVMNPIAEPTPGLRTLSTDPGMGLITGERFDKIPTAYVVQRLGAHPGEIALTFDDGPDPHWTPQILKILKEKHVPATFFVIGENMETWPELVRRELADGHIVGSHTYTHPNIGTVSNTQVNLELNLTQRLFQVITGHTMRFFRPPYLGDASPSTPREVAPLITARDLGYLSVGLRVDPDDWKRPDSKLIVSRTLDRLKDTNPETAGQVVLLHDSGGDRSHTIAALPHLIDALRARGYRLVTVAELAGLSPAQAMPPTRAERGQLLLDRAAFDIVREFDKGITVLFVSAIVLGLARLLFLSTLAIVHRLRAAKRPEPEFSDDRPRALVTVLIPCFNEEAVIVASIQRILQSSWRELEVLVLDDGSKDATAARVQAAFGEDPRVQLMSFTNGGKAAALNRGLKAAKGDIVVALDADTQFPSETIGRLAAWFQNPKVGAVAGNALVGNRINLITKWQALEYVTAQNLERRALSALGVITVVPGAVGAWRRSAIEALGGFPDDTLAEDQDLTLAVQRAGWAVEFDPEARAYTEAPQTMRGLLKQRFRWSFGTLQCVWKHRAAILETDRPLLGLVALPQVWMFQIFLALVAPLVDAAVLFSLFWAALDWFSHPTEWDHQLLNQTLLYWGAFVLVDLSAAALGMALERDAPWGSLGWLPVQRFGYRQLMYHVVIKAVITAVRGPIVGWNKIDRKATVTMDHGRTRDAQSLGLTVKGSTATVGG
ncbi:polysaccharide deacetylase family protein [Caulobacter sp. S45]|uniref:polysaccharide deacetylase family protein n=1 Tax=Caulobacter sp. S45 TaxID=1641861 RepID=UPI00131AEA29|nr:polysaccharide deacetylase family protein [Caulobacter sp. S45]